MTDSPEAMLMVYGAAARLVRTMDPLGIFTTNVISGDLNGTIKAHLLTPVDPINRARVYYLDDMGGGLNLFGRDLDIHGLPTGGAFTPIGTAGSGLDELYLRLIAASVALEWHWHLRRIEQRAGG